MRRALLALVCAGCSGGPSPAAIDAAPPPDVAPAPDAAPEAAAAPLVAVVLRPPSEERTLHDLSCALDGAGDGLAVWRETDIDFGSSVWASVLPRSPHDWQPAARLGARPATPIDGPFAAVDGDGRGLAVWNESGVPDEGVIATRYLPATGWEPPARISTGWVSGLRSAAGGEAVAFGVVEGDPPTLLRYSPATGWSADATVGGLEHKGGTFLATALGRAALVWNEMGPAGPALAASDYTPGAGWTATVRLQEARPLDNPLPILNGALAADGSGFLLWNRGGEAQGELWGAGRGPGGPWEAPHLLTDGAAATWTTRVAAAEGGAAVAVWETGAPPVRQVTSAVRTGDGWQPSAVLGRGSELTAGAVAAGGTAIVAWSSLGGVSASRYTAAAGWSAPRVWTNGAAGVASLCVAVDEQGRGWIVWIGESPQVVRAAALVP